MVAFEVNVMDLAQMLVAVCAGEDEDKVDGGVEDKGAIL